MKFPKDILIIDFEGLKKPVQIGAVLLDKETLEEKDHFLSYIYADLDGYVSSVSGISQDMIDGAPKQADVGKVFYEKFGTDVFLSAFVQDLDISHLKKLLAEAGFEFKEYDFRILDIWPIAYTYLLKQEYQGDYRSDPIFREFGIKPRGLHNALEDCRIAAEVLRIILEKKNN
ncbi:MAG: 3'-5' exonuclease [Candidatus Nomurabacteria bacterium]|nr:3'-5' exonuclease [Candidatus Nomurabacteria bacterium]USN87741.1 MAG: 3'-5' exonuclease [Candidatus Nomurabacteria bacterium]